MHLQPRRQRKSAKVLIESINLVTATFCSRRRLYYKSRHLSIVEIDATGSSHALPCFLTLESMSESQTDPRDHRREGALWMSRQRDTPQVPANGKRRAQRSVPDPCFIAVVAPRT